MKNPFKKFWAKKENKVEKFLEPGERLIIYNLPYKIVNVQRVSDGIMISMDFDKPHPLGEPQEIFGI